MLFIKADPRAWGVGSVAERAVSQEAPQPSPAAHHWPPVKSMLRVGWGAGGKEDTTLGSRAGVSPHKHLPHGSDWWGLSVCVVCVWVYVLMGMHTEARESWRPSSIMFYLIPRDGSLTKPQWFSCLHLRQCWARRSINQVFARVLGP